MGDPSLWLTVRIWEDGKPDTILGQGGSARKWSEALDVDSKVGKLSVTAKSGLKNKKRWTLGKRIGAPAPPRPLFEKGPVEFAYGDLKWDTGSTDCKVGDWDNGNFNDFVDGFVFGDKHIPNRQMDCGFDCEIPG